MHKLGLSLLFSSMMIVPAAALSQDSAAPTADDYVCALTGDCGEDSGAEAAAPTEAAPSGTPRVSATRGFSLSAPTPTRPAPRQTTNRPTPRQTTNRPSPRQTASRPSTRPAARPAGQLPRVDLRLAFERGSATLTANDYPQIRAFAEALQRPQLADSRVRIEGHTDSSGGRTMNMELSQRRAQAVADFLASQGVAPERLEVRGFGFDRPLPGRRASSQENRRVEAVRIS